MIAALGLPLNVATIILGCIFSMLFSDFRACGPISIPTHPIMALTEFFHADAETNVHPLPVLWYLISSLWMHLCSCICQEYCEICRKDKMKFGGSTCSSQIISLTQQKPNLNNFKIMVYYTAGILCQGTHNVVVVVSANVVLVVSADVVLLVVVFAFGVRRSGNVFAWQRGASQVLVE